MGRRKGVGGGEKGGGYEREREGKEQKEEIGRKRK